MDNGAEFGVDDEGASFPVPKELAFNGEPGGASSDDTIATTHVEVEEVASGFAVEPGSDDAIHPRPVVRVRDRKVTKNVILQRVLA